MFQGDTSGFGAGEWAAAIAIGVLLWPTLGRLREFYKRVIAPPESTYDAALRTAKQCREERDFASELEYLRQAQAASSESDYASNLIVTCLEKLGRLDESLLTRLEVWRHDWDDAFDAFKQLRDGHPTWEPSRSVAHRLASLCSTAANARAICKPDRARAILEIAVHHRLADEVLAISNWIEADSRQDRADTTTRVAAALLAEVGRLEDAEAKWMRYGDMAGASAIWQLQGDMKRFSAYAGGLSEWSVEGFRRQVEHAEARWQRLLATTSISAAKLDGIGSHLGIAFLRRFAALQREPERERTQLDSDLSTWENDNRETNPPDIWGAWDYTPNTWLHEPSLVDLGVLTTRCGSSYPRRLEAVRTKRLEVAQYLRGHRDSTCHEFAGWHYGACLFQHGVIFAESAYREAKDSKREEQRQHAAKFLREQMLCLMAQGAHSDASRFASDVRENAAILLYGGQLQAAAMLLESSDALDEIERVDDLCVGALLFSAAGEAAASSRLSRAAVDSAHSDIAKERVAWWQAN